MINWFVCLLAGQSGGGNVSSGGGTNPRANQSFNSNAVPSKYGRDSGAVVALLKGRERERLT